MSDSQKNMNWEKEALAKYSNMLEKIPLFHRQVAVAVVEKKAAINAKERNSDLIGEEDIVRAFLTEVPPAFYSLMIKLMDNVGFDYRKYEQI